MSCSWSRPAGGHRRGVPVVAVHSRVCRYHAHRHVAPRGQVRWTWRDRGDEGGTDGGERP